MFKWKNKLYDGHNQHLYHTTISNENQIKIYGVKKYFKKILKTDKTNNGNDDQKQCPVSHTRSQYGTSHTQTYTVDRIAQLAQSSICATRKSH